MGFGIGFNVNKCKTQCQLCVGRIKLMRNKRTIQLKNSRRDVATLLRNGKAENARIRVEAVMREEAMLQAYDVVELFVELLQVRVAILDRSKELPPDMTEAISSLIYAAGRVTDLPELAAIRQLLSSKFGKEYAAEAGSDHLCRKWHVNDNLIRWLSIDAPSPEDKIACLTEIAQEHGVDWNPHAAAAPQRAYNPQGFGAAPDLMQPGSGLSGGGAGGWGSGGGGGAAGHDGGGGAGGGAPSHLYGFETGAATAGGQGPFDGPTPYDSSRTAPPPAINYAPENSSRGGDGGSSSARGRFGFGGSGRTGGGGGGGGGNDQVPAARQQEAASSGNNEDEGIVSYPHAGSEADGVVGYPAAGSGSASAAGSRSAVAPGSRFDGEPSGAVRSAIRRSMTPRSSEAEEAAAFRAEREQEEEQQPQPPKFSASPPKRVSFDDQPPQVLSPPSSKSPRQSGTGWATPPGVRPERPAYAGHLDAVGKWKARKQQSVSPSPSPPSSAPIGGSASQEDLYRKRQAAYDAAPGPPPKPALAGGPPSAPPPPQAPLQRKPPAQQKQPPQQQHPEVAQAQKQEPKEVDELDELQKRFEALKRR